MTFPSMPNSFSSERLSVDDERIIAITKNAEERAKMLQHIEIAKTPSTSGRNVLSVLEPVQSTV